uniref:Uncharacterized protein n=1 Tax=Haptolina brevifila TaxID=156173 RepID=A0A7S2BJT5_9EUKA
MNPSPLVRATDSLIMRVVLIILSLAATQATNPLAGDTPDPKDGVLSKLSKLGADTVQKRMVVGGVTGFLAGVAVKKAQDTIVTCSLLGLAAVGTSCYMGWVSPADLEAAAAGVAAKAEATVSGLLASKMFSQPEEDVKTSITKGKVMLSNVYKRAPGLVAGGAAGALLGFRLG